MPQHFGQVPVGKKPMSLSESRDRLSKLINTKDIDGNVRSRVISRQQEYTQPKPTNPLESISQLVQSEVGANEKKYSEQVEDLSGLVSDVEKTNIEEERNADTKKSFTSNVEEHDQKRAVGNLVKEIDQIEEEPEDLPSEVGIELGGLNVNDSVYWKRVWDYHLSESGRITHLDGDRTIFEVKLPRDNEIEIAAAEQMYSGLVGIGNKAGGFFEKVVGMLPQVESFFKNPTHALSFEIVANHESIKFWVVIPNDFKDLIVRQIYGSYQTAQLDLAATDGFFDENSSISLISLKPKGKMFYPIRSAEDLGVDPLNALTSSVSNLKDGQKVIIQLLIQPADDLWRQQGQAFVRKAQEPPEEGKKKKSIDPKITEGVSDKISRPGFRMAARILVQAGDKIQSDTLAQGISRSFDQFSVPHLAVIKDSVVKIKPYTVENFVARVFPKWGNYPVFNTMELATMYHFPSVRVDTPRIKWLMFKTAPPPDNLPKEGIYLGFSEYRANRSDIFLGRADRRRHMYILGQTGTGKSEFLKSLAQQDIVNGEGLAYIDPHGDAVLDLLNMIPKERAEDVIYFDPSDIERPPGLNILEAKTEEAKHMVVNSFIGLLYKLYDPGKTGIIGPQLERTVRNVMLTAMVEEGNSMIEVLKLIVDPKFIETKIHLVEDPLVKSFWVDQMASTTEHTRSEQLGYFVSKFDRFVTEKLMRNIIGQPTSAFNFRDVMDKQKILLVNLSKGKLGEENSIFLGLLLVPRILAAAMGRVDMPEDERKDFYLYVDEFQNFATSDFVQILSEARKYRLCLTVANQFISQMQEDIRDAVFGNVGTMVSFRVGQDDGDYLEKQFDPVFNASDLVNLTIGQGASRLLIEGHPSKPFSFKSDWSRIQSLPRNEKIGKIVKEISRLKYGRDRRIVESEINARAGF